MLIRGLQNPFVTCSMSFQHEDVERSFYLVFVLSDPCSFYLSFVLQVASRRVDVPAEFIRSILCSDDIVKIMLHIYPLFRFDSGIRVALMSNVDSIPFLIGVLIFL